MSYQSVYQNSIYIPRVSAFKSSNTNIMQNLAAIGLKRLSQVK